VSWNHLRSIQSSKGIGEPPLFLGCTVLFALREALVSAREDHMVPGGEGEVDGVLVLDSPATAERLRLGVGDGLVRGAEVRAKEGEKGGLIAVE
jgi:xanthine dehydrogenase/oxidase